MVACFAQHLSEEVQRKLLAMPLEAILGQVTDWEEWRAGHPTEEDCWPPTLSSLAGVVSLSTAQ